MSRIGDLICGRSNARTLLVGALLLVGRQAHGAPVSVPFVLAPADFMQMRVEESHQDALFGRPLPEVLTRYAVRVTVEAVEPGRTIVLILNEGVDQTVDGVRGPAPGDLDSILLLAMGRLMARVELTPAGLPVRVTNWALLKDTVIERARARAAGNAGLAKAVTAYLTGLDATGAVYLFARPLAFSAAPRAIPFDPPGTTIVTREKAALPSFLPFAPSAWAFTLDDDPPSPDTVAVAWEGAPQRAALTAILTPIAEELRGLAPEADVDVGALVETCTVRQDFHAGYARASGRLIDLTGKLTITAGPFSRQVSMTVKAE